MISSGDLKLMAIFAHPDDESMGLGPTLAKYAAEGVFTALVTATRGEKGWSGPAAENPGPKKLGEIRQAELAEAAKVLGIQQVDFLDFIDGEVADSDSGLAIQRIVRCIRTVRPQVVVSFGPEGDYGHPDHIAIFQLTSAALVAAADSNYPQPDTQPHRVSKFYAMINSPTWVDLVQTYFGDMGFEVDGVFRRPVAWPEWAITTRLDNAIYWQIAQQAILCHRSQLPSLGDVDRFTNQHWQTLLAELNTYYRIFSQAPVSPGLETDLFAGLR